MTRETTELETKHANPSRILMGPPFNLPAVKFTATNHK
jgi:hypothetical protein